MWGTPFSDWSDVDSGTRGAPMIARQLLTGVKFIQWRKRGYLLCLTTISIVRPECRFKITAQDSMLKCTSTRVEKKAWYIPVSGNLEPLCRCHLGRVSSLSLKQTKAHRDELCAASLSSLWHGWLISLCKGYA